MLPVGKGQLNQPVSDAGGIFALCQVNSYKVSEVEFLCRKDIQADVSDESRRRLIGFLMCFHRMKTERFWARSWQQRPHLRWYLAMLARNVWGI